MKPANTTPNSPTKPVSKVSSTGKAATSATTATTATTATSATTKYKYQSTSMYNATKIPLIIPYEQMEKIKTFVNLADIEISGFGVTKDFKISKHRLEKLGITLPEEKQFLDTYTKTGNAHMIFVEDIFILPQENNSSSTIINDSKEELILPIVEELATKGRKLGFWWHSHVDMSAFWSITDKENIDEWPYSDILISHVSNKKGEFKLRYDMLDPHRHTTEDVQIIVPLSKEVEEFCKKEIEEKVTEFEWVYPTSKYPSVSGDFYSDYYDSSYWRNVQPKNTYDPSKPASQDNPNVTKAGNTPLTPLAPSKKTERDPSEYGFLSFKGVTSFFDKIGLDLPFGEALLERAAEYTLLEEAKATITDMTHIYKGTKDAEIMMNNHFINELLSISQDDRYLDDLTYFAEFYIEEKFIHLPLFTRLEHTILSVFLQEELSSYLETIYPKHLIGVADAHIQSILEACSENSYRDNCFGSLTNYKEELKEYIGCPGFDALKILEDKI